MRHARLDAPDWLRGDPSGGGNFYRHDDPPMEGWICPAMFKYYQSPPKALYVKAEPRSRRAESRPRPLAGSG